MKAKKRHLAEVLKKVQQKTEDQSQSQTKTDAQNPELSMTSHTYL